MKLKLSALVLSTLMVAFTGQALADTPSASCTTGGCFFTNLQPYNNGAGQAAYYYCTPNSSTQNVTMTNHSVMITGFNSNGILNASAADVLKYAFAAYQDTNKPFFSSVAVVDSASNASIPCFPGTNGRPIMAGPPQLH